MSIVESKTYDLERFEYVPYRKYTITEDKYASGWMTADGNVHFSEEDAETAVQLLLKDRKRYNEVKKAGSLTAGELHKLFPKHKAYDKTPKDIAVIKPLFDVKYTLQFENNYEICIEDFKSLGEIEAYIGDLHDVRWNLDMKLTEIENAKV